MKVSVLIPTYNRSYIIGDAIESALNQSYRNSEILVIDDGSSDETRRIVEAFGQKVCYLQHGRNRGCSAAYNTGISAATGELVAFLDSDDVWQSDYLQRQVTFFSRHPEADVVFSDAEIRGLTTIPSLIKLMNAFRKLLAARAKADEYVFSSREMYLCLLEEVPVKPSACVVRKELFQRAGLFDETWPSGTDWDLFLRFSRSACFGYINRPLVVQRRTRDATHQKFREQDKLFLLNVLNLEKNKLHNDPEALSAVNRGITLHYNSLAWTYLEKDEWAKALSVYWRGFRQTLHPILLRKLGSSLVRMAFRGVTGAYVWESRDTSAAEYLMKTGELPGSRVNGGPLVGESEANVAGASGEAMGNSDAPAAARITYRSRWRGHRG
ncbi:MAG: glycosyltransferase [Acidobacteriia bacterium]|nr:glycosyltransferase [Terriglobia bacterium]